MRTLLIPLALFFSFIITGFIPIENDEIKTFILIRHAEKVDDSRDPDLSESGIARAILLDQLLANVQPDAIYTSPYIRTQETIRHIAHRNQLKQVIYDPQAQNQLVKELLEENNGFTFIISGHSNTIPELANLLLNRTHFEDHFDESDYGNLLIITVSKNDAKMLHLRF